MHLYAIFHHSFTTSIDGKEDRPANLYPHFWQSQIPADSLSTYFILHLGHICFFFCILSISENLAFCFLPYLAPNFPEAPTIFFLPINSPYNFKTLLG